MNEDGTGVLRWAVVKSLSLLRIYRDELDEVANAMMSGLSVSEIITKIENVKTSDGSLVR